MNQPFIPLGYTLVPQQISHIPSGIFIRLSLGKKEHGRRTSEMIASVLPCIKALEQAARVHDIMSKEEIEKKYGKSAGIYAEMIQGSRRDILHRCRGADLPGRALILADLHDQLMVLDAFYEAEGDQIWKKYRMNEKELYLFSMEMQRQLLHMVRFSEETRVLYIDTLSMINDLFSVSYTDIDEQKIYREYADGTCFTASSEEPMWLPAGSDFRRTVRISNKDADTLISRWNRNLS